MDAPEIGSSGRFAGNGRRAGTQGEGLGRRPCRPPPPWMKRETARRAIRAMAACSAMPPVWAWRERGDGREPPAIQGRPRPHLETNGRGRANPAPLLPERRTRWANVGDARLFRKERDPARHDATEGTGPLDERRPGSKLPGNEPGRIPQPRTAPPNDGRGPKNGGGFLKRERRVRNHQGHAPQLCWQAGGAPRPFGVLVYHAPPCGLIVISCQSK
jgi:hypothetical protein